MYLDGSAMLGVGKSTFGFGTLSVGSGGASPESKDTETYLYRNEVLDNVDALTAELKYLLKQVGLICRFMSVGLHISLNRLF